MTHRVTSSMSENRKAIVIGGTGLSGTLLIKLLSADPLFSRITAPTRRALSHFPPKLNNPILDFDKIESFPEIFNGSDLFFCFGTTRKKVGTEKFREIELGFSQKILSFAKAQGVQNIYLISSKGASLKSSLLYSKTKGEIEKFAENLDFHSLNIFRPSLLLEKRDEFRIWEKFFLILLKPLSFLFIGPFKRIRPIPAITLCEAMIRTSHAPKPGVHIFENEKLFNL